MTLGRRRQADKQNWMFWLSGFAKDYNKANLQYCSNHLSLWLRKSSSSNKMSDYHEHVYLPCNQLKQMYHDQSFYLPSMVSHNTYYHSSHMASFNQLSIKAPTHTSSQTTSFFGQSKYSPTDSGIGGSPSFLQASPDHFTGSSLSHPTPTANFNFFQNGSVELSTSSADVSTQMRHKKGPTEKKKCSREGKLYSFLCSFKETANTLISISN